MSMTRSDILPATRSHGVRTFGPTWDHLCKHAACRTNQNETNKLSLLMRPFNAHRDVLNIP